MTSLREQLLYIMKNYQKAKTETFKEHSLGNLVRREVPHNIYTQVKLNRNKYLVKGSVGQGNWAYVPWIAIMNKEITISTQRGYYLVYLFAEDMSHVYLAFAQGVTETQPEEMSRINREIRENLDIKQSHIHKNNNFYLGESKYAKDYVKSTALYISYSISDFPTEDKLWEDLNVMLGYYESYIEIANKNLLSPNIEKFLSEFIKLYINENDFAEIFGEIKGAITELLFTKKLDNPNISHYCKEILAKLPFVNEKGSQFELVKYSTLDLPDANYRDVMDMLRVLLGEDDQIKHDINKNVKSRALQGLKILQYINKDNNLIIHKYPDSFEQRQRVTSVPVIKMILELLVIMSDLTDFNKREFLIEIIRHIAVNSVDGTQIKENTLDRRYSKTIDWLKSVDVIDENLTIIESDITYDFFKNSRTKEVVRDQSQQPANIPELMKHIHQYILSKGFFYKKEEVTNLYLSLRAKPFVILSGISGTGKTKMVQWFAESVGATEENGQFKLIPIRPDWNDGSDLLGYVDIKGEFKEGPLTKVIKNATQNPEMPYFVLLDEMNLARVEHYFSDILSVMESRKWNYGKVVSSNLLAKETAGFDLPLPNNLYVIGTVNMDETTYPFSKKVLDRANTIEFNRVDLGNFDFLNESDPIYPLQVSNKWFEPEYLHIKDVYFKHKDLVERVTNELIQINNVLEKTKAHVGYRVRDEICFYMVYNDKEKLLDFDLALDYCILQKILPRISGSDSAVDQLLRELYEIFTGKRFDEDVDFQEVDLETAKYPHSARKVIEMLGRLNDGYTSFWIT